MKKLLYAKGKIGYSTPVKSAFLVTAERNSIMIDLVVVIFLSFFLLFCLLMYFWTGRRKLSHPESAEAVDGTKLKENDKGAPFPHSKYFEILTISYFNMNLMM